MLGAEKALRSQSWSFEAIGASRIYLGNFSAR